MTSATTEALLRGDADGRELERYAGFFAGADGDPLAGDDRVAVFADDFAREGIGVFLARGQGRGHENARSGSRRGDVVVNLELRVSGQADDDRSGSGDPRLFALLLRSGHRLRRFGRC